MQILIQIGFELRETSFRTEVVSLALVQRFPGGVRWIDGHSTDWIDGDGRLLKNWKHQLYYQGTLRLHLDCCDNFLR